jgi:hypothetical protein
MRFQRFQNREFSHTMCGHMREVSTSNTVSPAHAHRGCVKGHAPYYRSPAGDAARGRAHCTLRTYSGSGSDQLGLHEKGADALNFETMLAMDAAVPVIANAMEPTTRRR